MKNFRRRFAVCVVLGLAMCFSTNLLADSGGGGGGGDGASGGSGPAANNVAVGGGTEVDLVTGRRDYTYFSLTNNGIIAVEVELECYQGDRCGSLKTNKLRIEPGQTISFNGMFGGKKIKLINRTAGSMLAVSSKT